MRLDEYLLTSARGQDGHHDPDFEQLLGGRPDSTTAAQVWATIADGSAEAGTALAWAQHVARRVVADVVNGAERDAAPAALRALGFYGRVDKHRTARDYLATVASFDVMDQDGNALPAERLPATQWLRLLRRAGHLLDLEDKTAINKINAWRMELGID